MTASDHPATCGACVQFLEEPRADTQRGELYTCKAYRIFVTASQTACRTIRAHKADDGAPDQGALL